MKKLNKYEAKKKSCLPDKYVFLKNWYLIQNGMLAIMRSHFAIFVFKKSVLVGVVYKSVSIILL